MWKTPIGNYASSSLCLSAILMAMMFESCGPSFQYSVYPLHASNEALRDETLTGYWQWKDGSDPVMWHILLKDDGTYEFHLSDGNFYSGHLVRVGGERFFDFLEVEGQEKDMHFFCKLEPASDWFSLRCLNPHLLDSEDEEGITLQHVLITSSSELQGLLSRHVSDPAAYENPFVFTRIGEDEVHAYEDKQAKEAQEFLDRFGIDLPAALAGDAVAQEALGKAYARGKGKLDSKRSRYWYWRAASQGRASAQIELARLYERNDDSPPKPRRAFYWYLQAAMAGHADAQFRVGRFYSGLEASAADVNESDAVAVAWFEKAAAQDQPEALSTMAYRYSYGVGVAQDEREAVRLYVRYLAMRHDDAKGWEQLISIYQSADDTSLRNPAAALKAAQSFEEALPADFARWSRKHSLFGEVVQEQSIDPLPVNGRNYIDFVLTDPPAP